MFVAFAILCLLIAIAPGLLFVDDSRVLGGLAAASAAAVLVFGANMRAEEIRKVVARLRPVAIPAATPIVWMLIQVLPLGFLGLAHSMWTSAEVALGYPLDGSISIDPGATLLAAGYYLSAITLMLIALGVALDRRRAGLLLNVLAGATTAIAALLMVTELARTLSIDSSGPERVAAIDCVVLGATLTAASGIRTFERYQTRNAERRRAVPAAAAPWVAAFLLCWVSILLVGTHHQVLAAGFGLAILALIMAARRLDLGIAGQAGITAIVIAAVGSAGIGLPSNHALWPMLAETPDSSSLASVSGRMLADGPWTGTGAGTFAALRPIYRDAQQRPASATAPTAATKIAIELGQIALWVIVVAAFSLVITLAGGALRRGRDAFHPAAAASCVVALLLLGFFDAGLLAASVVIVAAAAIGLGLAQRVGRSVASTPPAIAPGPRPQAPDVSTVHQNLGLEGD